MSLELKFSNIADSVIRRQSRSLHFDTLARQTAAGAHVRSFPILTVVLQGTLKVQKDAMHPRG
ncbi:hypothetical protein [Caballeronia catudaia]|uniref:hypothetical protein n=1 Tax=Caballeronia catudaia TaxID=1777136 RepID=UPI000ACA35D4|nr:hypothetical protein [Caballeronia catudaia]